MLSLTLMCVQVHHMGVQIGLRQTDSPDQRRELLEDVQDGQGLTIQHPSSHRHHVRYWVYQAALVKI